MNDWYFPPSFFAGQFWPLSFESILRGVIEITEKDSILSDRRVRLRQQIHSYGIEVFFTQTTRTVFETPIPKIEWIRLYAVGNHVRFERIIVKTLLRVMIEGSKYHDLPGLPQSERGIQA